MSNAEKSSLVQSSHGQDFQMSSGMLSMVQVGKKAPKRPKDLCPIMVWVTNPRHAFHSQAHSWETEAQDSTTAQPSQTHVTVTHCSWRRNFSFISSSFWKQHTRELMDKEEEAIYLIESRLL